MRTKEAVTEAQLIAEDAGVEMWAQARRFGGDHAEASVRADDPVAIASLYKLPLALAWSDEIARGTYSPTDTIVIPVTDRAAGPTGVSTLADPVTVSQRDAVRLMLALSDNAAAEAVLAVVSLGQLAAWLQAQGLQRTRVRRGAAASWQLIAHETGGGPARLAPARLADPDRDVLTSEYDPATASTSTARELTDLLQLAWSAERHTWIRESMAVQVWRHRIGSGFPHDDVRVHGKTGTLARLRHEAAVVEFPHEVAVAVTVLTYATRPETQQPRVDAAIGAVARTLVHALRVPLEAPGTSSSGSTKSSRE